jgi:AcrR family transcriptional regulator
MPKILDNPKQNIYEKAKEIIERSDFTELSMRELAKECSLSIGTIYNYYKDKGAIYQDIISQFWKGFYFELEDLSNKHEDLFEFMDAAYFLFKSYRMEFVNMLSKFDVKIEYSTPTKVEKAKLLQSISKLFSFKIPGDNEIEKLEIGAMIIANFMSIIMDQGYSYEVFKKMVKGFF